MSRAWQWTEEMAVNMPFATERWNILSKGSLALIGSSSPLGGLYFLSPPVIHPGLVGCRKTPISDRRTTYLWHWFSKFGFHHNHWGRSYPYLPNHAILMHTKVGKPQICAERIWFFLPQRFCTPLSPVSCSSPGNSYHYVSWIKCDNVNWSDNISN